MAAIAKYGKLLNMPKLLYLKPEYAQILIVRVVMN